MSKSVYAKLAVTNLKNNRKTYLPYLLTSVLTVMMFYILDALTRNKSIGDGTLQTVLVMATNVVAIFSVIFLFYTNSFLIKRRKKEIGVYNILGMGKRHIARMLLVETAVTTVISIGGGLLGGIIFGKLMYLVLLKILHYDVNMNFAVIPVSVQRTVILFLGIFLLTLIYNLLQIRLANPIELLRGSRSGEKEPKTKIFLAAAGVILVGIGYYIALATKSPMEALGSFFVAVVCVILGTYALFMAGSIALLKMLRKNKGFYYKTKHFTSVSGMIYRMKQNAVGLANICILSTMVLVMISTSVSLYMGMEDVLKYRYPKEYEVSASVTDHGETEEKINQIITEETKKAGVETSGEIRYHEGSLAAVLEGDKLKLQDDYSSLSSVELRMIPQEDYNRTEKADVNLAPDEILVYTTGDTYGKDTLQIGDRTYRVMDELQNLKIEPKNKSRVVQAVYVVMDNREQIQTIMDDVFADSDLPADWIAGMKNIEYIRRFDLTGSDAAGKEASEAILKRMGEEVPGTRFDGREMSRGDFYLLYGGLLFIGIYLGALFLMATVLIIYYKQISEGYDDRERFQIMQKVGMSRQEVKRSIRSQVVSVFFLPLVTAVIHITVAFPVVTKLMATLNLVNVPLFRNCTIATVAVFALFYGIVYAVTAREYYKIVK